MDYKDRFLIIDDSLFSNEEKDIIERYFTSDTFPWYMLSATKYSVSEDDHAFFSKVTDKIADQYQMSHIFVRHRVENSEMVKPNFIMDRVQKKYNLPITGFERVKSNLCSRISMGDEDSFQTPHVDLYDDHLVMIYYVNDSDGDTIIFNEMLYKEEDLCNIESVSIRERITPKKGRIAIFNGRQLHSGCFPRKNDFRIVVNFDLLI